MRSAVSTMVIAAVVIVVVAVAGVGAFFALGMGGGGSTNTTTTSTSNTGGSPPAGSLSTSVNSFISAFNNRDVTTIKTYFTDSSKIDWTGATGGLGGNYTGTNGAGIVYGTSVGHASSFTATPSSIVVPTSTATTQSVTFHLDINGTSQIIGAFSSTVDVAQTWTYSAGTWTITTDHWNYLTFSSANTGQATVFPQWSLLLNGKSPSLAQEHVIEWNVAPFLAAGVYAVILAFGAMLLWVRVRKHKA